MHYRFGSLDLNYNGSGHDSALRSDLSPEEEEKMFLRNQVKALEEAKQLLTGEVMSLRQSLTKLQSDHVPNGAVLDRVNELAAENVGLKAALDDLTGENVGLKERLNTLEVEKVARDSKDDAAVLKQELINVQKTMDEALRIKEDELKKLRKTYDDLFYERQNLIDTISGKEAEVLTMKNKLAGAGDTSKSVEEHLGAEKEKLSASLEEKDQIIKGRDEKILSLSRTLEQKITLLEEKLETEKELTAKLEHNKSITKIKTEELDTFRKSLDNYQREESKLKEKTTEQELNVEKLKEKLKLEKKENEDINVKLMSNETLLKETKNALCDSEKKSQDLSLQLEETASEVSRLTSERTDLLAKIEAGEGVNEAIQQLKTENTLLQEKLEEAVETGKTKEAEYSGRIRGLECNISSLENHSRERESKIKDLREALDEKHKLLQRSEQEKEANVSRIFGLEEELVNIKDVQKKMAVDQEEAIEAVQNSLKEKDKVYQKMKAKCDKAQEDILRLEDKVKDFEMKIDQASTKNQDLIESNSNLEKSVLKEKLNVEKLQTSLNEANDKEEEQNAAITKLQDTIRKTLEKSTFLEKMKKDLEDEKITLEKLVVDKTNQSDDLNTVIEANNFRIKELENGLSETEKKVNEMKSAIEESLGKERNLLSDIEAKNKTIFAIEEEKANIVINFESQQTILERLTGEKDSALGEVRKQKSELESLEEKICQLQTQAEMEKTKVAEEMMELRTAKDLLLSQIVDLKNDKESLAASIVIDNEKNQARFAALEIKLQDSKLNLEKTKEDLDKERSLHSENQKKSKGIIDTLEMKVLDCNSRISDLTEDTRSLTSRMEAAEGERDEALSRTLELEAGVSSALEERRGLLERCVAAEAETERTRNMSVELRRKLDDAHAALHELGRENQSIQVRSPCSPVSCDL